MKVEKVKISEIIVLSGRQREDLGDIEQLAESFKEFGQFVPIVISDRTLVAGERRIEAAKLLNWDSIHAVQQGELDPIEMEELELEENVRRKNLAWDEEMKAISRIYEIRNKRGESMRDVQQSLGVSLGTVAGATKMTKALKLIPGLKDCSSAHKARKMLKMAEEKAIKKELLKRQKPSDLNANYLNQDCRELLMNLPAESVDLILTDPPFGIDINKISKHGIGAYGKIYEMEDDAKEVMNLMEEVIELSYKVLRPNSHMMMFFGIQHYSFLYDCMKKVGFDVSHIPLIWFKEGAPGQTQRPEKWLGSAWEPIFFAHKGFKPLQTPGKPNVLLIPHSESFYQKASS